MTDEQLALPGEGEVPCMLLPMDQTYLLVPTVSVAEMAPVRPLQEVKDKPDWLMGFYTWRNCKVPVIAYEVLNGTADEQNLNPEGRIAVLNNTGVSEEVAFIAIHTQGIPRMARVGADDIVENNEAPQNPFDLMPVKIGLDSYIIPDISALEKAYMELNLFL